MPVYGVRAELRPGARDESQHITIIADDSGAACARVDAAVFRPGVPDVR